MAFLRAYTDPNPQGEFYGDMRLFKSSPKAPAAPDPAKTAAAQTATNKETAYWNAVLNNVNQITPYGNLTYTQTGGGKTYNDAGYQAALQGYNNTLANWNQQYITDQYGRQRPNPNYNPTAQRPEAPKYSDFLISDKPPQFTSQINLSPEQQKIYETQTAQEQKLLDIGGAQMDRINQSVSTPYSYSNIPALYGEGDLNAARLRTEEALYSRLNPQFDRDEEALRTRLINQGIGQGSEAYNTEMNRFNQAKTDARMQAILAGGTEADRLFQQSLASRQQGIQEYDTQRNAPLNEYIGLTSGTQVRNPQFSSTGYQGAAPVDYAGLVNNQYQAQLGAYNAKIASNNATQGAVFGLLGSGLSGFAGSPAGSAAIAGWLSDETAKENIVRIGQTPAGIGVYEFSYKEGLPFDNVPRGTITGVLAQEVEKIIPDAVYVENGYKHVNYAMVR